ncbi:uncharacterized protein [Musca autumnalis]|uniref:uncharacterized protein n=1 Tax=Musca autumnalis TaxID=221902 RepID=UPI003CE81E6B
MTSSSLQCPICVESYDDANDICSTVCGHVFHNSCLSEWLGQSDTCPMCNKNNPAPHRIFIDLRVDQSNSTEREPKLVIKGIPSQQLTPPFYAPVMDLIRIMQIHVRESDIRNITRIANTLHVTFRQVQHMEAVLKNKYKLKKNPNTSAIVIYEVVDPTIKALFAYSHKLKQIGYKIFFIRDNKVFVKKEKNDNEIEISSKEQVDRMCIAKKHFTPTAPALDTLESSSSHHIPVPININNPGNVYEGFDSRSNLLNFQNNQTESNSSDSDDEVGSFCCCS